MEKVPAADNFRVNLRTAMEVKGLSQRKVAELAGCSFVYVNRVLQGHTEPGLPQCEQLAKAVGFPLSSLIASPEEFNSYVLTAVK